MSSKLKKIMLSLTLITTKIYIEDIEVKFMGVYRKGQYFLGVYKKKH